MSPNSEIVFDCHRLRVSYGSVQAVGGIDLQIRRGERVAVLGCNGAGKTSLLSVASGMRLPSEGELKIFGHSPGSQASKQKVTYLPQVLNYPGHLKTREIFDLVQSHYPGSQWHSLAQSLALNGVLDRKTSCLSGGENRKIGVVNALMCRPDLVILDEPTANIDIEGCRLIEELIEAFCSDSSKTLIFSSHVMKEVERLATRIVVMKKGLVVADGPKTEIKREFGLRKLSFRSRNSALMLKSAKSHERKGDVYYFLGEDSDQMLKEALSLDPSISHLEVSDPDLEEILLKIWGRSEENLN